MEGLWVFANIKQTKISQFFLHKDGRFMGFCKYEIIRFSPSKMEVFLWFLKVFLPGMEVFCLDINNKMLAAMHGSDGSLAWEPRTANERSVCQPMTLGGRLWRFNMKAKRILWITQPRMTDLWVKVRQAKKPLPYTPSQRNPQVTDYR